MSASSWVVPALLALAAAPPAQVTVTATTLDSGGGAGAVVSAATGPAQAILPDMSVTTGLAMAVNGTDGTPPSSASVRFSVSLDSNASDARLDLAVHAAPTLTGGRGDAEARIELLYTSPVPIAVRLDLTTTNHVPASCLFRTSAIDVVGVLTLDAQSCSFLPTCSTTAFATIDAMGLRIDLSASTWVVAGTTGICSGQRSSSASVSVRITPLPTALAYGTSCGATMLPSRDLLQPAVETIRFDDSASLPIGTLLIGTQQASAQMPWSCDLLVVPVVGVPLALDENGDATFSFVPPLPATLVIQGAAIGGRTIHMSNGLQL